MIDFSWSDSRSAGVFLHISSLPSEYGVGNVGRSADAFFEFLDEAGMGYWQICPLGPTGFGDSPYQSFSAFAGNPYFIDPEPLRDAGLIDDSVLAPLRRLPKNRCDYGSLYCIFPDIIRASAKSFARGESNFGEEFSKTFGDFCADNSWWLDSYALFTALKRDFGGAAWREWPAKFAKFTEAKKQKLSDATLEEIFAVKFGQWVFFSQYEIFRKKAGERGVKIFGDLPIFLSLDSADVWEHRELFELNKDGSPKNVAGVGPDYFCEKGQLWGNPLYDWKAAKRDVYEFWAKRVGFALKLCDVIRFDHFRGFADYWSIPAKTNDARKGSWKIGPAEDFFAFLRKRFPTQKFVAEDLGLLSQRAVDLRDKIKIPAMAVMQFAFGDNPANPYLPHNLKKECVYYTGTHDNDTALGWYNTASEKARDELRRYFRSCGNVANWDMIHAVLLSVARLTIIPMQDILGFGSECRMNTPGKPDGNWQWRMTSENLEAARRQNAPYLKSICELGGRYFAKIEVQNSVEKSEG